MQQVLKAFPCSFDGTHIEMLEVGDKRDFGSMAAGLRAAKLIGDIPLEDPKPVLRQDGPTIAEFVAAGYPASNYPPRGYASRSTPEEIAAAVEAESAATAAKEELAKMTNAQLIDLAKSEEIEVEANDNKATLVDKIVAGRAAKASQG